MPFVSVFYGIIITINFWDHAPPHLHAAHGGAEALFDIRTGKVIRGKLEWIVKNRIELLRNWDLAAAGRPTFKIAGLDRE